MVRKIGEICNKFWRDSSKICENIRKNVIKYRKKK